MTLNWNAPLSVPLIRRKLALRDLYTLRANGVVGATERIELINGELTVPPGQGPTADLSCKRCERALADQLMPGHQLCVATMVRLSKYDATAPDLVVASRPRKTDPVDREAVQLAIEITEGPHAYTDELKPSLYAAYEIPDYWLIDVTAGTARVHRGIAAAQRYSVQETVSLDATLTPLFNPSLRVLLKDLVATNP